VALDKKSAQSRMEDAHFFKTRLGGHSFYVQHGDLKCRHNLPLR
jgi:hypothetical protein